MTLNRLRADLASLADDAFDSVPDLRNGVLRGSQRLRTRRLLAASTAVVAVVVAISGVAFAMSPTNGATPNWLPPGNTDGVPTAAAPSATPLTPTPTADPTTPSAGSGAFQAMRPMWYVEEITGGLTYLARLTANGVLKRQAGRVTNVSGADSNFAFSPDGKQVVTLDIDDATPGKTDLMVWIANLTGAAQSYSKQWAMPCFEPAWSADSSHLLVGLENPNTGLPHLSIIDANNPSSGTTQDVGSGDVSGCHYIWSADGQTVAYSPGDGRIAIMNIDGTQTRTVPHLGPGTGKYSVNPISLSPDGSRIVLDVEDGQPTMTGSPATANTQRTLTANTVLDTRTGEKVALPIDGTLLVGYYQPDGTLVARVKESTGNAVVWISKAGQVLHRTVEPAELATMDMLV